MGANKIIELKSISVEYDGIKALDNASLNIYENDFLGIIGPNGGGKTTLIKSIVGGVSYKGEIVYHGIMKTEGKRMIGYLPQINNFDRSFPIAVKEVVLSGLMSTKSLFGRYTRQDKSKALELIEQVGLIHLADKAVGELSGGELQRLLLCRALISDPKLLILDEPANFVDNNFERELYEILRKLNEKIAIIMVSHDVGTITSVVKNIVCVNKKIHRHNSNIITTEQLHNYNCPIRLISHGGLSHIVLERH